jgi:SAM-dependent methyltransferase
MAFLSNYEYDVFISYAHVDNYSDVEDRKGWVDQFNQSLRRHLAELFGRGDSIAVWWDRRLPGNEIIQPTIVETCRRSALLICLTSPGYFESEWCRKEHETFCTASAGQDPPRHGNRSRVFNVRLRDLLTESHMAAYEKMFGQSMGYQFYDSVMRLWPTRPTEPDQRYEFRIEAVARDVHNLLRGMWSGTRPRSEIPSQYVLAVGSEPGPDDGQAEEFFARLRERYHDPQITLTKVIRDSNQARLIFEATRATFALLSKDFEEGRALSELGLNVEGLYPGGLAEILSQATERVIISGHTLNRFSHDDQVRGALVSLLRNNVRVTLMTLNPESKYARAHAPYHELESERPAGEQHREALEFLAQLFKSLDDASKARFEVLLSNYMPRFRTILVDDDRVYLYLYMYGEDVSDYPDLMLEKGGPTSAAYGGSKDSLFTKVVASTNNLKNAPEIIPYIRYGVLYKYWERSMLAQWDSWTSEVRRRHKLTHHYYNAHAREFHNRFGNTPERYVQAHLDLLGGRTVILGCGSGKEAEYLFGRGRCDEVYGIDSSPKAVELARREYPHLAGRFIVGDFYDLEFMFEGRFDSIVANAAFVHLLERGDMSGVLRSIHTKLRPGGRCFIRTLYREQDGQPVEQEYFGAKDSFSDLRWFVYYSRSYLCKLAKGTGFCVDEQATKNIVRECGFRNLHTILKKGFSHEKYEGVYWPTLVLLKAADNE